MLSIKIQGLNINNIMCKILYYKILCVNRCKTTDQGATAASVCYDRY